MKKDKLSSITVKDFKIDDYINNNGHTINLINDGNEITILSNSGAFIDILTNIELLNGVWKINVKTTDNLIFINNEALDKINEVNEINDLHKLFHLINIFEKDKINKPLNSRYFSEILYSNYLDIYRFLKFNLLIKDESLININDVDLYVYKCMGKKHYKLNKSSSISVIKVEPRIRMFIDHFMDNYCNHKLIKDLFPDVPELYNYIVADELKDELDKVIANSIDNEEIDNQDDFKL